jgi:hypothetical protein
MNKIKSLFLSILLVIALCTNVWAVAGTVTGTISRIALPYSSDIKFIKVTLTCTGGTAGDAGTIPATVINTLTNVVSYRLTGTSLRLVQVYPGGVTPTDASDMTITMDGVDILGGRGTNLIDATSYTSCAPGTIGAVGDVPITGNMTLNVSNNSVASSVFTIILTFVVN